MCAGESNRIVTPYHFVGTRAVVHKFHGDLEEPIVERLNLHLYGTIDAFVAAFDASFQQLTLPELLMFACS